MTLEKNVTNGPFTLIAFDRKRMQFAIWKNYQIIKVGYPDAVSIGLEPESRASIPEKLLPRVAKCFPICAPDSCSAKDRCD